MILFLIEKHWRGRVWASERTLLGILKIYGVYRSAEKRKNMTDERLEKVMIIINRNKILQIKHDHQITFDQVISSFYLNKYCNIDELSLNSESWYDKVTTKYWSLKGSKNMLTYSLGSISVIVPITKEDKDFCRERFNFFAVPSDYIWTTEKSWMTLYP